MVALPTDRRVALHRRALWLEYFTVGWNVVEAVVAVGAGVIAGSVALIGFGADSAIEVIRPDSTGGRNTGLLNRR